MKSKKLKLILSAGALSLTIAPIVAVSSNPDTSETTVVSAENNDQSLPKPIFTWGYKWFAPTYSGDNTDGVLHTTNVPKEGTKLQYRVNKDEWVDQLPTHLSNNDRVQLKLTALPGYFIIGPTTSPIYVVSGLNTVIDLTNYQWPDHTGAKALGFTGHDGSGELGANAPVPPAHASLIYWFNGRPNTTPPTHLQNGSTIRFQLAPDTGFTFNDPNHKLYSGDYLVSNLPA